MQGTASRRRSHAQARLHDAHLRTPLPSPFRAGQPGGSPRPAQEGFRSAHSDVAEVGPRSQGRCGPPAPVPMPSTCGALSGQVGIRTAEDSRRPRRLGAPPFPEPQSPARKRGPGNVLRARRQHGRRRGPVLAALPTGQVGGTAFKPREPTRRFGASRPYARSFGPRALALRTDDPTSQGSHASGIFHQAESTFAKDGRTSGVASMSVAARGGERVRSCVSTADDGADWAAREKSTCVKENQMGDRRRRAETPAWEPGLLCSPLTMETGVNQDACSFCRLRPHAELACAR